MAVESGNFEIMDTSITDAPRTTKAEDGNPVLHLRCMSRNMSRSSVAMTHVIFKRAL